MALKLIAAATTNPISLEEAKLHLRVEDDDEDTLIEVLIAAATKHSEKFMGRALIAQTWDLYVDQFPAEGDVNPGVIKIPLSPLLEVVGLFYRDASDVEQEFAASSYLVDDASEPARVVLVNSASWPTAREGANAVRIRFRAGYVDNSMSPQEGEVPADIRSAILLYLGSLYAHRETVVIGQTATAMPWGAEQLLRMNRVDLSMA